MDVRCQLPLYPATSTTVGHVKPPCDAASGIAMTAAPRRHPPVNAECVSTCGASPTPGSYSLTVSWSRLWPTWSGNNA